MLFKCDRFTYSKISIKSSFIYVKIELDMIKHYVRFIIIFLNNAYIYIYIECSECLEIYT